MSPPHRSSVDPRFTAAQTGDPEAFASLIQARIPTLLVLIRRIAGKRAQAPDCSPEDLLQDALLRAWRLFGRTPDLEPEHLPRWLGAVTRNAVRERLKQSGRRNRAAQFESETGDAALVAAITTVTQAVSQQQMVEAALLGLARLPETQQVVLHEHLLAGRSLSEISAELGITKNAVWERLQRGLRELRGEMVSTSGTR